MIERLPVGKYTLREEAAPYQGLRYGAQSYHNACHDGVYSEQNC